MAVKVRVSGAWITLYGVVIENPSIDYLLSIRDTATLVLDTLLSISATESPNISPQTATETPTVVLF